MDVRPSPSANGETSGLGEPGKRLLEDPAMSSDPGLRFEADPRVPDASNQARVSAPGIVLTLAGVAILRASTRMPPLSVAERRDRFGHRLERLRVGDAGRARANRQRYARRVGDQVVPDAGPGAVRRVRAELFAPLLAGTHAGIDARPTPGDPIGPRQAAQTFDVHPIPLAGTLPIAQPRQQVTPTPQPISASGDICGMPVMCTNTIPVRTAPAVQEWTAALRMRAMERQQRVSTIARRSLPFSFFVSHVDHQYCPGCATRTHSTLYAQVAVVRTDSGRAHVRPRVHRALRHSGIRVGDEQVRRSLRQLGLASLHGRPYRVTTDSAHAHPIAGNLLDRDFDGWATDRAWVADITYAPAVEGRLHLTCVLDSGTRAIVGWRMSDRMRASLVRDALTMA